MIRVGSFLVIVLCTCQAVYSWTETLSVEGGDCDSYNIRHVNNDHDYKVKWDGGKIPNYCRFPFIGRDDGYQNEYKVCVEATEFNVDCSVKMEIQTGIVDNTVGTYSCNDVVYRYCGNSDEYLTIELDTVYSKSSSKTGDIELKITAELTYNYSLIVGLSVGGAILGVILMSTLVACTIRLAQRRNQPGRVIQTTITYPAQQANVYGYQEGVANPAMYPPVGTNMGAPPPSYNSVVTNSGNMTSPIAGK